MLIHEDFSDPIFKKSKCQGVTFVNSFSAVFEKRHHMDVAPWMDGSPGGVRYRAPYGAKNDRPGDDGTLRSV